MSPDERLMAVALDLARESIAGGGRPFGAVVAVEGRVVGRGTDQSTRLADPTHHAEVAAIREAAGAIGLEGLRGAVVYASCSPCLMCLAVILRSGIPRVCVAADRETAERAGFSDIALPSGCREHLLAGVDVARVLPAEGARVFDGLRSGSA